MLMVTQEFYLYGLIQDIVGVNLQEYPEDDRLN